MSAFFIRTKPSQAFSFLPNDWVRWVERPRTGPALHVSLVKTQDLFEFILRHPERDERRRNREDATEFIVVRSDDLRAEGPTSRRRVDL